VVALVKVIVHNLSKVDDTALLNLHFTPLIQLNSGSVNKAQVSDKVLSVDCHDHKLGFPKLFVVWNLVVIGLTFSDLEASSVSFKSNLYILELLCVNTFKLHLEFLFRELIWLEHHFVSLQQRWSYDVFACHIFQRK
jgi:hypothetical protein